MVFLLDPLVQIAIDESRNILYSRSEKGVIQVIIVSVRTCVYITCSYVFEPQTVFQNGQVLYKWQNICLPIYSLVHVRLFVSSFYCGGCAHIKLTMNPLKYYTIDKNLSACS